MTLKYNTAKHCSIIVSYHAGKHRKIGPRLGGGKIDQIFSALTFFD